MQLTLQNISINKVFMLFIKHCTCLFRISSFIYITIGTTIVIFLASCNKSGSVFSDESYQDTIKQNNGGIIIRNIHYYNDFKSFDYEIDYIYKDKDDCISTIGHGLYYNHKPPKDEQLIQFGRWLIFKTSGGRDNDILFIYNNNTQIWSRYEISPYKIECADLWIAQNIASEFDNWDSVTKISNIDKNGKITVLYTYRKKNSIFNFNATEKRNIIYKINSETGVLEMIEISRR